MSIPIEMVDVLLSHALWKDRFSWGMAMNPRVCEPGTESTGASTSLGQPLQSRCLWECCAAWLPLETRRCDLDSMSHLPVKRGHQCFQCAMPLCMPFPPGGPAMPEGRPVGEVRVCVYGSISLLYPFPPRDTHESLLPKQKQTQLWS